MYVYSQDSIVALATAPGEAAIAVVRISGGDLAPMYKLFSKRNPKNRFATYSKIYHPVTKKLLDEVIITFFKGPNSFTGEDVIEISCHGGPIVSTSIIRAAIDAGIRNAKPGEFSFRSFLNGKIDLVQAESIASIISSKSRLSADICLNNLSGRVSSLFLNIKKSTLHMLSIIENELNFSQEEINFTTYEQISLWANKIKDEISSVLEASTFGNNLLADFRVVIAGRANSGKSSLFNSMIGYDRSIVSRRRGTTRDTIEALIDMGGVNISLNNLGVKKTIDSLKGADICILIDENDPSDLLGTQHFNLDPNRYIFVKSKCDLNNNILKKNNIHYISSKNGVGINKLLTALSTDVSGRVNDSNCLDRALVTKRQLVLLQESFVLIKTVLAHVKSEIETDIIASTMRSFLLAIEGVVGEVSNQDVIDNIFSNFCVGK